MKVQVTEKALIGRINRKLAKDYEAIKKTRPNSRAKSNLGDFYLLNTYRNTIIDTCIKLEQFARDRGVLAEYEEMAE